MVMHCIGKGYLLTSGRIPASFVESEYIELNLLAHNLVMWTLGNKSSQILFEDVNFRHPAFIN